MFSLAMWYSYTQSLSKSVIEATTTTLDDKNVCTHMIDYILDFIVCEKCQSLYDDDGECVCFIVDCYDIFVVIEEEEDIPQVSETQHNNYVHT